MCNWSLQKNFDIARDSTALKSMHLQIIQSLASSADIGEACCWGETERRRSGDADDARDDDDTDADRDLALSLPLSLPLSLALSLVSLSDILARVFELVAFSL